MASCCGGSSRKNAAAFVVMGLLLVVTTVGWWREAHKEPPATPAPQVETVEVLVAATDMTTGTTFTKDNIGKLTTFKTFPKSEIDPGAKIVTDPKELIGKRLTRAKHAEEFFTATDLHAKTQIFIDEYKDILSLPMRSPRGGFIVPGSRVDIVASVVIGTKREVFTLLPDMYVFAVNGEQDLNKQQIFPETNMVSFAVDEKQAKLIELATKLECNLELLLRHPDAPRRYPTPQTEQAAYDKVFTMLTELAKHRELHVAPPPREVGER